LGGEPSVGKNGDKARNGSTTSCASSSTHLATLSQSGRRQTLINWRASHELRSDMRGELHELRSEMREGRERADQRFENIETSL
jgi:hypothetical protein